MSALLNFVTVPVFAQFSLSGNVISKDQKPIANAALSIPDLNLGTYTDQNGHFEINDLPQIKLLLSIRSIGYNTLNQPLEINGNLIQNFILEKAVVEENEVVVTGTSNATLKRRAPIPVQTISMEKLSEHSSTNIIDALSTIAGVSQISTGAAISKPVIRGLGYNRTLVLSDGVRQEGQQWGDEHGVEIDDSHVQRVEILKGPASLIYGSDALAGVINIITEKPLPEKSFHANVGLNYQSNNGLQAFSTQLDARKKKFNYGIYFSEKNAHDYKNLYDGYVLNSRFNNLDFGGHLGWTHKKGTINVLYSSFHQKLGIPEGVRDSATGLFIQNVNINGLIGTKIIDANNAENKNYQFNTPYQNITHQKIVLNTIYYLPHTSKIATVIGFQNNQRKEFGDVLNPITPGLNLNLNTLTFELKFSTTLYKNIKWNTGINGMNQQNTNRGNEFIVPNYSLFDIGAFTTFQKEIKKLTLEGGIRFDTRYFQTQQLIIANQIKFNSLTNRFKSPTGSIGASYLFSKKLALKSNVAAGYRAPNVAELASNGVHEGTKRYEYGNTLLKPEKSFQIDAGLEFTSEHILINTDVFYNHINNYIFIRKLLNSKGADSIPVISNPDLISAFQYNATQANLFGFELNIDIHPHPFDWLHIENSFSYVNGQSNFQNDSMKYLPSMPPARWLIDLKAQFNSNIKFLKNSFIKFEIDNNFKQNKIFNAYETEKIAASYTLINATLGSDFITHKGKTVCTFRLIGQNLINQPYQNHLSRLNYLDFNNVNQKQGIWGMGRNICLNLNFPINGRW